MSRTQDEVDAIVSEAISTIERTASLLTASAPTGDVKCSEGDVVEAAPTQGIDFGGVTSCMTLTCILSDGSKVAGHAWQFGYEHILSDMQTLLSGKTVSRILIAGVGGAWTPDFKSQATILERFKERNDIPESAEVMEHMGWSGADGYARLSAALAPFSAAANTSTFTSFIGSALGGTASFTESSSGSIKVTAEGALS